MTVQHYRVKMVAGREGSGGGKLDAAHLKVRHNRKHASPMVVQSFKSQQQEQDVIRPCIIVAV
jgi:hypothetical protein